MSAQVYRWEFRAPEGELGLSLVPWEGGPDYWTVAQEGEKMTKAEAAGWSDPAFFPICVFLSEPQHAEELQAIGVNTYMAANHVPPITDITSTGMFVIAQSPTSHPTEWTLAEIGSNANVVGWFVYDECEQGEGACNDGACPTENDKLDLFQSWCDTTRGYDDGRFLFANFGNGVLRTFWSPNVMDEFVQSVDAACIDKYAYTSPPVNDLIEASDDWPGGSSECAAAYGWFVDQMRTHFDNPANRTPQWVFIETKMPFLTETDARIILYDQIRGAVWSAIAHEARGIAYFQHNGMYNGWTGPDPNTGVAPDEDTYSLVDCEVGLRDYVEELNAQVASLAPVLNTQSYVFDFGAAGIDTMLKGVDGFAYIFASVGIGGTTGSKTFTVTGSGITGTNVEVVDEARSLTVSGGSFSDTFAQEYSHHIYKVAI